MGETLEARLLGSGGWMPTDERETGCLYVRKADRALLIDAGTGLRRLVTEPSLLEGVARIDIVLTHFHLDHVVGLSYLPALDLPVHVWAGGRVLADRPSEELVHRLLDPPFLLRGPELLGADVAEVHELEPPRAQIGPFGLELRVQRKHRDPTLALRLDGVLAYCTDTAYDEENTAFARGSSVLLHEAFWAGDATEDNGHTASGEAARLADAAGVERLVLIHVNPLLRDDEELLRFARTRFPATEVAHDGLVVAFSRSEDSRDALEMRRPPR